MPIIAILYPIYDSHLDLILSQGSATIRTRNPARTRRMLSKRKWQRRLHVQSKLQYYCIQADPGTWETEDPDFLLTVSLSRN